MKHLRLIPIEYGVPMRNLFYSIAIIATAATAPAAFAQTDAQAEVQTDVQAAAPAAAAAPVTTVKPGAAVVFADGRRVGAVSRVIKNKAGDPVAVAVIYDSRFVNVPVSTLSVSGSRYVTSLSRAELRKLK